MTTCPKCRDEAATVILSWPQVDPYTLECMASAIRALPTHPQDAEVRVGIARIIGEETDEWASVYYEIADAILAYLHAQGWRRVGEGEVVVPREPTKAMLLESNPNIGTYLGTQMEIDAAGSGSVSSPIL